MKPQERGAQWITKAMELAGIDRQELVKRLGVNRGNVYQILYGNKNFRINTLFKMIEACGFEVVELKVKKKQILH